MWTGGGSFLDAGGGFSSIGRRGCAGAVVWGIPLCLTLHNFLTILFMVPCLSLTLVTEPIFLFLRVWICWGGWACKGRRSSGWKLRGCKNWIGSGRIGGRRSVQALERSHISLPHVLHPMPHPITRPYSNCHHFQATSSGVQRSYTWISTPVVEEVELASEATATAISKALKVAIPVHMAPLHLQLGGIKRVYKCWVEGCSKGPSTSWAAICVHVCKDHLGVTLACPSCVKNFLNWDALRYHRKTHSS